MAALLSRFCKFHDPPRHPARLDGILIRRRDQAAAAIHDVDGSLHFLGRRLIKLVDLILLQHKKLGIEPRSGKWMKNPAHTRDHLICPHIPFFRPAEEITPQGLPLKHGQLRPVHGSHVNHDPFDILSLKIGIQEIIYFLVISVDGADPLALPQRVRLQKVVVQSIDIPLLFDGRPVVIPGQEILDLRVVGKFIGHQLHIIEQLVYLCGDGVGSLADISNCLILHFHTRLQKQHGRNHRKGQKHPHHQIEKQLLS